MYVIITLSLGDFYIIASLCLVFCEIQTLFRLQRPLLYSMYCFNLEVLARTM